MAYEITITPEMKEQFQAEVNEHLDAMEKMLLVLEKQPGDREAINAVFRAAHSIKGNSDYIGVRDMNILAHGLEDLMDEVRSGNQAMTGKILEILLTGLDRLRDMNARITGDYRESDPQDLLARIDQVRAAVQTGENPPTTTRQTVDVAAVFAKTARQHIAFLRGVASDILADRDVQGGRDNVLRILRTFGTSAHYVGADDIVRCLSETRDHIERADSLDTAGATQLLHCLDRVDAAISGRTRKTEEEAPSAAETIARTTDALFSEDIRVGPAKIETFMNRIAELNVAANSLTRITRKHAGQEHAGPWTTELGRIVRSVERIAGVLQDEILKVRLERIDALFERLPRIVREIARTGNKEVELVLLGGETEIDRKIIEYLVDPVIHLIRNAVDHGIEAPDVREERGKPRIGTLTVTAYEEGSDAIIEILDDGSGLDERVIAGAAGSRGIVDPDDLETMGREEILNLIFVPGFSTASRVTEISGRGVGLDVVRENMKKVGGNTVVESEPGKATRVRLQVPVSMAVLDVLLVEARGELYGFPFTAVRETLEVNPRDIRIINRRESVAYRDGVLCLEHLTTPLQLENQAPHRLRNASEGIPVVVITFGGQTKGIAVDKIVRRDGILSKPLDPRLAGIPQFSGAALLDDGTIALVLDPAGMIV